MKVINVMVLFALVMSGCAVTDFDKTTDFTGYRTYTWGESNVDVDNPVYDSDLINKRIRRTIEAEFLKRGIVKSDKDPDFVVLYHTYTEDKVQRSAAHPYPYPYRFYPYGFYPFAFHPWGYPFYMAPPLMEEYTEGTLIIDIIDRDSDELWRGAVSGNVDNVASLRKQIEKGVKAIMKKYPISPDDPLLETGDDVTV
jgi:hypothetical protein